MFSSKLLFLPRGFQNGKGRTPFEFSSCEKLFMSAGYLFLGALVIIVTQIAKTPHDPKRGTITFRIDVLIDCWFPICIARTEVSDSTGTRFR